MLEAKIKQLSFEYDEDAFEGIVNFSVPTTTSLWILEIL